MSDASIGSVPSTLERLAPYVGARRDRVLPILIGVSLFVHATVFLPSLFHRDAHDPAKQEIPVEIVQLPPEAPKPAPKPKAAPPQQKQAQPKAPLQPKPTVKSPAAKPPAAKPPEAKPPAQKATEKPAPKQPETKPEQKAPEQKVAEKPRQPTGEQRMKQLLGTMPAVALPGTAADGDDAVDYSQLVLSKVAKAKKQGRYNGIPGASAVAFTIGDAGELIDVHTARPSGDPTLDEEAIAMVKRGAPYPPPPPGGRRDFAITLRFHAL